MTPEDAAVIVARRLQAAGIPHLLVGSFSSNHHGLPRSTKDVDIVVQAPGGSLMDVAGVLGDEFIPEDQFRFETNTGTVCQEFAVRGSLVRVEIFTLSGDAQDQARFARRVERELNGQPVCYPTAEDVIVWKLRWARPKDLDDVRNVIFVQEREGTLDWDYIRGWCAKHGTTGRLEGVLAAMPQRKQ